MNLAETDILALIPQRPPFVMVDKLVYCDENSAKTSFTIAADNIFVEEGLFREAGLAENIAQTAAARSGFEAGKENKPAPVGYIGGIKNLEILELPAAGDELLTEISIENQIFDVTLIAGKVYCKNKLMAQCQMRIFINNIKPLQS